MRNHLDVINSFLSLNNTLSTDPTAFAAVLHPDFEQLEYPNPLNKHVQRRSFDDIIDNMRLGREMLMDMQLELLNTHEANNGSVVVEARWQATSNVEIGPLFRGQHLTSHMCLIFEFLDGKIFRQRSYHCHEQL
jgi:ketosteroid isomerase-like protein